MKVFVALLLSLGLASTTAALDGGKCGSVQVGVDYPNDGFVLAFATGGSIQDQLDLCCKACAANARCKGYTVALNQCVMLPGMTNPKPTPGSYAVKYTRPDSTPAPASLSAAATRCENYEFGIDYPGNDIKSVSVSGNAESQQSQCCKACTQTTGCNGFTIFDNMCFIKSAMTQRTPKPMCWSAAVNVVPTSPVCTEIEIGTDYQDNWGGTVPNVVGQLETAPGTNQKRFDECSAACAASAACGAITLSGTRCILRASLTKSKAEKSPGTIAATCLATLPTSTECQSVEMGFDYPGNDVGGSNVFGTAQDQLSSCCRRCQQEKRCKGFVIQNNICKQKSALVGRTPSPASISGTSLPWPTTTTCSIVERWTDYIGNDIRNVSVSGSNQDQMDACCTECSNEASCSGYVITDNKCLLKTTLENRQGSESDSFSARYYQPPLSQKACSPVQRDYDYPGNDLRSITVSGNGQAQTDACCAECSNDGKCAGFSIFAGVCTLKTKMANGVSKRGVITGVGSPLPTSTVCPAVQGKVDYPGGTLRQFPVYGNTQSQMDTCCNACTQDGGCIGFVFFDNACYLKKELLNPTPNAKAISATYTQALPTSTQCKNIEQGVDYPGNDIRSFTVSGNGQSQLNSCCSACANDQSCAGFVVVGGTCWIKSKMLNPTPKAGCFSGAGNPLPTSTTCANIQRNIDYPGNDIRSFGITGTAQDQLDKCCAACSNEATCVGFVFHSNTCWLKSVLTNRQGHGSAIAGSYKQPLPKSTQCQNIEQGVDYPHNDIRSFGVSGNSQAQADACCDACSADARCRGFVFHSNTCWIKTKLANRQSHATAIAGTANPVPTSTTCAKIEDKIDYPGNDIRNFKVSGSPQEQLDACCDACTNDASCAGFVFHSNTCWIKSVLANRQGHGSAIAGSYKQTAPASNQCQNVAVGYDYPGNNIRSFDVSGNGAAQVGACCSACADDATCVGFVVWQGSCSLKDKLSGLTPKAGAYTGTYAQPLPASNTCGNIATGFDYPGNDLRSFSMKGNGQAQLDQCCDACSNDVRCAGFVFHDNKCWIKSTMTNKRPLAGCVAATYAVSSSICSKVAIGFDYPGNDIRHFVVKGNGQAEVDACCDACTKDTTCAGFVVHDDTCWIKTVLENKTKFPNCLAGAFTGKYNVSVPLRAACAEEPTLA